MRTLVTGAAGFVGRHLVPYLLSEGDEVWALARSDGTTTAPTAHPVQADLRNGQELSDIVAEVRPDVVYHLAAQSSTTQSLRDPWATIMNNIQGQLNLVEAIRANGLRPRVLVIGSSDEYGTVGSDELPTNERVPLAPVTAYGISKVAQDLLGYQYYTQHGLPIVRVRPFSHIGPGQDDRFFIPSMARQIAEIELGASEPVLRVGNLEIWRDFTDVRDMVRAYRLAVLSGVPGEVYNIGTGLSTHLGSVVTTLVALAHAPVTVSTDPARVRSSDVPHQLADATMFVALTGWCPRIPLATTLEDTLDYWRARVGTRELIPA